MDPAPTPSAPPVEAKRAVHPIERAAAILEVILCSGFPTQVIVITLMAASGMKMRQPNGELSAAFVFTLTLLDTVLLVSLIFFFMRTHREGVRETLFAHAETAREVAYGFLLIPLSFLVVILVLVAVQLTVPSLRNVLHNPLQDLARTRAEAILFGFVVMVAGGVREEMQRGFVLRRFEQYLGGGIVGLVLFSAVFGLGHLEQGYDVALATAVLGAFWGAIYLVRRSILAPMIGHAGFNLAQVVKFVTMGM